MLLPLSQHLLQCIASADVVWADETPLHVLDVKKTKLGYLWTFLTQNEEGQWLIGYRFSMGRGGKTPREVLGGTAGALVVDGYTGYNAVTLPKGRVRVGCWAHVRRRFFDALATAPEAREALDFILELYRVEAQAKDADLVRTAAHRELRQLRSAPILARLRVWLEAQAPRHPPKTWASASARSDRARMAPSGCSRTARPAACSSSRPRASKRLRTRKRPGIARPFAWMTPGRQARPLSRAPPAWHSPGRAAGP
ncbi:transposase orf3, IS66 family [Myxococcus xanthus DK 1622]|uniref:Transposase orf3, IS66 family n=1 Tax=Myxococcus xanthus (strain DK1622) TaxID=246197 RepID=Q1D4Y1_MYXXD|nr:transposase [Myxococcus xanthus]ABF88198.1 transposase orf3, IS66 family [Myxococcus xanthus DK 1622]QZZ51804.1 transposase orf3, IS66 family [Myxococcus xanthus]UYI11549.1 transposase [Myxococcus xanthus]UYI18918.1 transposase [Myxococcus xanthus]SDW73862.1 Transposase IS66 family protein [Myxococcus xanthus]